MIFDRAPPLPTIWELAVYIVIRQHQKIITMAAVKFNPALGIQSISGKIGNLIFYTRNGKQFARRVNKNNNNIRGILESLSDHSRTIPESKPVLTINH